MADRRISHANTKLTRHSRTSPRVEQGAHCWPKTAVETQTCLAIRVRLELAEKLHVELDFTIGGVSYTVVRKGTKITLEGGEQKVSGTKPVDEAVRKILGYDLNVFDVANACNQGNIEALSDMTPTARKAMVDKTVGLTVLDDLIKFAGQEGNTLKREAAAMGVGLVEPVEPEQPEYYLPSASVTPRLQEAQQMLTGSMN